MKLPHNLSMKAEIKSRLKEKKEVTSWVADAITAGSFSLSLSSSAAAIAAATTAVAVVTTLSRPETTTVAAVAVANFCDGGSG